MNADFARQITKIARDITGLQRRVRAVETTAQGRFRSVSEGATTFYDENGVARLVLGTQPDGSYTQKDLNGPPPPAPSAPVVTPYPGSLLIVWDGQSANGAVWPSDFSHVEVHVSTTAGFEPTNATEIASFHSIKGGAFTLVTSIDEYFIKLVAVSTSGAESVPSIEVSETALDIIVEDIPPTLSPKPEVIGGISVLHVVWPPTDGTNLTIEVHISTNPDFIPVLHDPATLAASVKGTMTTISTLPSGSSLVPGTPYYIRTIAFNETDDADPSEVGSGTLKLITGPDIAVNAAWVGTMSVDRLVGGDLLAEQVRVRGEKGVVALGPAGEEVGLYPTGFKVSGPTSLGNPVYIDFPTDGRPNIISGILRATTLEVEGTSRTVTNKSLTSNVATLTLSPDAGFTAGSSVVVTGVGAPFDGPITITATTPTTISYSATGANVGSTASSGLVMGKAMSLRGLSELASGSQLKMASGIQAPISGPVVTQEWGSTSIPGFPVAGKNVRAGGSRDGWFYFASGNDIKRVNEAGTLEQVFNLNTFISPPPGASEFTLHSFCRTPTRFYVFGMSTGPGNTPRFGIWWIAADGSSSGLFRWDDFAVGSNISGIGAIGYAMGSSDAIFLIIKRGNVNYRETYLTDGTLSAQNAWSGLTDTLGSLRHALSGNFDFGGSQRTVVVYENGIRVIDSGSGTRIAGEEWPLATSTLAGVFYESGRFWSLAYNGSTLSKYSVERDVAEPWWVGYTKNNVSLNYTTPLSTKIKITPIARKFTRVTATHTDTPDARIYFGKKSTEPTMAEMFLASTLTGAASAVLLDDIVFSGTTAPTTNTFPTSSPAEITSTDGSTYWRASGIAKLKELILTSATDVTTDAGNTPPLRVGEPSGNHLRIDGNEILSMISDTVTGPLGIQGKFIQAWNWSASPINVDLDANGRGTINHGLGVTPGFAMAIPHALANERIVQIWSRSATTITIQVKNGAGANITTDVDVLWFAIATGSDV